MRISILGSGSSGNSIFLEVSGHKFLVDAGFSCKKIEEKLNEIGESLDNINGILITHEHGDHIMGAGVISRKYNIPIYIDEISYNAGKSRLGEIEQDNLKFINGSFYLSDQVRVYPFEVMHDAEKTLGYRIVGKNSKVIGVATDIGYINNVARDYFKNLDILVIECNYNYQMLMECRYPWELKHRVKGRNGHLSNEDAARFICEIYTEKLKKVYLAHVSKDSNCYQLALETVKEYLVKEKILNLELEIAYQDKITKIYEI